MDRNKKNHLAKVYSKRLLPLIYGVLMAAQFNIQAQNRPFPQQIDFPGCIKPSHVTQDTMNSVVTAYYKAWKSRYLKKSDGGKTGNGFYINMKGTGGSGSEITTSEAHGYGMIIFALMAGHDDSAKIYFDGMVNLFDLHRSTISKNLMSWVIDTVEGNSTAATDGDMDIAYALILAHNQWGSDGEINYRMKADSMINSGIKGNEVRKSSTKRTTLGDWDNSLYHTRSSDWMPDHFRAFHALTKDTFWLEASDTVYSLITKISTEHSPVTGLMPDFVTGKNPAPAEPDFLEAQTDGDYSWNACRFPWRIAVDYAHNATVDAKEHLNKMLAWLKTATNDNPGKIVAGYHLDGTEIAGYSSRAFTAPFIASCVCDATHQEYLNKGWNIIRTPQNDYYGDSIGLLCLLFISGNWWKPGFSSTAAPGTLSIPKQTGSQCRAQIKNSVLSIFYDSPAHETVKFSLLDVSGRLCKEMKIWNHGSPQTVQFDMDALGLKPGVYLLKVSSPANVKGIPVKYSVKGLRKN